MNGELLCIHSSILLKWNSSKSVCQFNEIQSKSQQADLVNHDKLILKCIWKRNGSKMAKEILERRKMLESALSDFKIHCKAVMNKDVDEQEIKEHPETVNRVP